MKTRLCLASKKKNVVDFWKMYLMKEMNTEEEVLAVTVQKKVLVS